VPSKLRAGDQFFNCPLNGTSVRNLEQWWSVSEYLVHNSCSVLRFSRDCISGLRLEVQWSAFSHWDWHDNGLGVIRLTQVHLIEIINLKTASRHQADPLQVEHSDSDQMVPLRCFRQGSKVFNKWLTLLCHALPKNASRIGKKEDLWKTRPSLKP
jgi:hypothetical protein